MVPIKSKNEKLKNHQCPCGSSRTFGQCCFNNSNKRLAFILFSGAYNIFNKQAKEAASSENSMWNVQKKHIAQFLSKSLKESGKHSNLKVAILGAGNCEDIPLNLIVQSFNKIDLIDIDIEAILAVKNRLPKEQQRKVRCIWRDLTGLYSDLVSEVLYYLENNRVNNAYEVLEKFYESPRVKKPLHSRYDLVISINTVSQLFYPSLLNCVQALQSLGKLPAQSIPLSNLLSIAQDISNEIIPVQHLNLLHSIVKTNGKVFHSTDRLEWGDSGYNIKSPVTDMVDSLEDLFNPDIQSLCKQKGYTITGSNTEAYYTELFSLDNHAQWLWHFSKDRVYLVEGFMLSPKQI